MQKVKMFFLLTPIIHCHTFKR